MTCSECGKSMNKSLGTHHYVESGLDNVYLEHIPIHNCTCGASVVGIPAIMALHELICITFVSAPVSLKGKEIKFIRSTMGHRSNELAQLLDVHKVTVSRWESDKVKMNLASARLFKVMVLDHFSKERKRVVELLKDISVTEKQANQRIEDSINKSTSDKQFFRVPAPVAGENVELALELV